MYIQRWTTSVAAVLALSLGASAAAQAQPSGYRYDRPHHHAPGHHGHPPGHGAHRPGPPPAHWGHRAPPPPRHYYRGSGPHHNWTQGVRIPHHYRSKQYVVHNWRHHGLQPPPRGYHWVQYGSDYLLVAIATGVISQLIIHGMR